jgi:hypothetical protein
LFFIIWCFIEKNRHSRDGFRRDGGQGKESFYHSLTTLSMIGFSFLEFSGTYLAARALKVIFWQKRAF